MTRNHRIVVALDPAAPRDETFEAILALYDAADADITALFIEDENLLRLAALPGVVEVRALPGGGARPFDQHALRDQLDRRAAQVRETCERAALTLKLRSRFLIVRGDVMTSLAGACVDAELLVVGRSLRSAGLRTWLGAAPERLAGFWQRTTHPAPRPPALMFVHEPWRSGRSVMVLDDGDASGARAVHLAEALAAREGLPLERLLLRPAEGAAATARIIVHADRDGGRREGAEEGELSAQPPGADSTAALRAHCARADPRVLVLPLGARLLDVVDLDALLADLPTSLVLSP